MLRRALAALALSGAVWVTTETLPCGLASGGFPCTPKPVLIIHGPLGPIVVQGSPGSPVAPVLLPVDGDGNEWIVPSTPYTVPWTAPAHVPGSLPWER